MAANPEAATATHISVGIGAFALRGRALANSDIGAGVGDGSGFGDNACGGRVFLRANQAIGELSYSSAPSTVTPYSFRTLTVSLKKLQSSREFLNSLVSKQNWQYPRLTGPSAVSIIQWWQQVAFVSGEFVSGDCTCTDTMSAYLGPIDSLISQMLAGPKGRNNEDTPQLNEGNPVPPPVQRYRGRAVR